MPEYRRQVQAAVTWKIIAELMRRYHKSCGLYVYETHPCDGQYDCRSIVSRMPGHSSIHLCDLHQPTQHFHVFGHYRRTNSTLESLRWPEGNDYVEAFLTA